MQSPILIEYVATLERQWRQEQTARAWPVADALSPRKHVPRRLIVRFVLALLVVGLLLVSQFDAAFARPLPTCNQTSLRSIRPEISPPLPTTGTFCGIQPVHPTVPADTADPQPIRFELPDLAELWALVVDLLPHLTEVTAPHAAH